MDYRKLGRTDLEVSNICLGTMTWGKQNSEQDAHEQLDYATEMGVNFIDTAEMYAVPSDEKVQGKTESFIGNWLANKKNREDVILATKVVGYSDFARLRDGPSETRLNREQMTYALENSLKRLKTDYIDVYYMHWPDRKSNLFANSFGYAHQEDPDTTPIEETLAVLNDFVVQGKIRHIAVSNETPWGVMKYLEHANNAAGPRVALIQNAYSLVNRLFEHGLAEVSLREDIGLAAYSPLGGGVLSGKYRNGSLPIGSRRELFAAFSTRYSSGGTTTAVEKYHKLATDHGLTLVELALNFVDTRSFVSTNIIGATTMDQLKENIAAFDIKWNDELEEGVNKIHLDNPSPAP